MQEGGQRHPCHDYATLWPQLGQAAGPRVQEKAQTKCISQTVGHKQGKGICVVTLIDCSD